MKDQKEACAKGLHVRRYATSGGRIKIIVGNVWRKGQPKYCDACGIDLKAQREEAC